MNINGKGQILAALTDVFNRWQKLLSNMSEEQFTAPLVPSQWSVKDVIAHLWSWQQVSVARMQAALQGKDPEYPGWWERFGPDPEEDVDRTNAWLYEASRDKAWRQVHADWKEQFERYVGLARLVPEEDLLELGKFPWMGNYALVASAMGSLGHHEEHLEILAKYLQEHNQMKLNE
ncbi:MAG: hypothetical protein A2136_09400 [Chloroflexi bacterium RBG_16_54_11]|nr:MAG: hypothetical protein A2136_09400 [Chloroflexi bacterium RBG_16_54_11]